MSELTRLQDQVRVQAMTLQSVARNSRDVEELRRGVREVLAALEAAIWPLEQRRGGQ